MNTYEIAVRLRTLSEARKHIEAEEKSLKEKLLALHPEIEQGIAPPYIKVSLRETVELDQAGAQKHYLLHKDHRILFKLSMAKADFERLNTNGKLGGLKVSAVIQPNIKMIESTPTAKAA